MAQKPKKEQPNTPTGVDKTLVSMFLTMTPEERISANDNMIRTIADLRDAYRRTIAAPERLDKAD